MINMIQVYQSWLKRTEHITDNCQYCRNRRYYVCHNTMYACPACNWNDLQITKKINIILPLDVFVRVKNGEDKIQALSYNLESIPT